MDNEKKLDLSTANMQEMAFWPSVCLGNSIWDQMDKSLRMKTYFYTTKIGEVFAHIHDAKILRVVLSGGGEGLFQKFEEIDFANGNKEDVYLSFEKTMQDGVFRVINFSGINKNGTYIRVSPELWAKAEKQRDIFLSSLNALNYSINIDEPFNS